LTTAVFPAKLDPVHVGHLIQIKRLIEDDRYDRVVVDIFEYEDRVMETEKAIDIVDELIDDEKLDFQLHNSTYTKNPPEVTDNDIVFVTGNPDVADNLKEHGLSVKEIARFESYRAKPLRDEFE